MATIQKANKFFATHEPASHQGPECIHFAAFVPRALSLSDAKELRDVLTELLGDATIPLVSDVESFATEEKAVEETTEKPKKAWGKR